MRSNYVVLLACVMMIFQASLVFAQGMSNDELSFQSFAANSGTESTEYILKVKSKKTIQSADRQNGLSVGYYGLPESLVGAESAIMNFEFERFIGDKNSILIRAECLSYFYDENEPDYQERGKGSGAGLGFSYRHYFSDYGGIFISPGVEFAVMNWEYNYQGTVLNANDHGKGTSLAIAPNFVLGYRFNLGDRFSISPMAMAGYRFGISIEQEGDTEEEAGPLGGIGASLTFRF